MEYVGKLASVGGVNLSQGEGTLLRGEIPGCPPPPHLQRGKWESKSMCQYFETFFSSTCLGGMCSTSIFSGTVAIHDITSLQINALHFGVSFYKA